MKKGTIKNLFIVVILMLTSNLNAAIVDIYHNIDINQGDIYDILQIHQGLDIPPTQTTVNVYDGYISYLTSLDNSILNIYGGTIASIIGVGDNSTANLYGGIFSEASVNETATLNIYGYGFETESVSNGSHTLLTGSWSNGSELSILFKREDSLPSQVNLLPEPTTLFLLGIGGLLLRNKRMRS